MGWAEASSGSEVEALLALGQPVLLGPGSFELPRPLVLPAGARVRGVGLPRLVGAVELFDDAEMIGVWVSGAPAHGVTFRGRGSAFRGGRITDCAQNGVALRAGASENEISDALLEGNGSFGVHLDEAANRNLVERCRGVNRLELVGVRYTCWGNRILANLAEGTSDNGISVTGYRNVVQGNVCRGNAHSGIGVYGHQNVVQGNICEGNNLAGNPAFASIFVKPDFGGLGVDNAITGNVCLDDTGIRLRAGALGNVLAGNVGLVVDETN